LSRVKRFALKARDLTRVALLDELLAFKVVALPVQ